MDLVTLQPGDHVVHAQHGIGRFVEMRERTVSGATREYLVVVRFDASLDVFNVLNSNVVLSENQNFGASLGAPLEILQPRLLRISTNLKF